MAKASIVRQGILNWIAVDRRNREVATSLYEVVPTYHIHAVGRRCPENLWNSQCVQQNSPDIGNFYHNDEAYSKEKLLCCFIFYELKLVGVANFGVWQTAQ